VTDDDVFDELATRLGEDHELRESFAIAEREWWCRVPLTLHVNAETGDMISPSGTVPDDVIVEWERDLRAKLAESLGEPPTVA